MSLGTPHDLPLHRFRESCECALSMVPFSIPSLVLALDPFAKKLPWDGWVRAMPLGLV